jgi:tetratricopeptide (TPR) repeat protein
MNGNATARNHMESGLKAHQAGDLARAIAAYRTGLTLDPDDPVGLNLLGTAILQSGDPESALPLLERASQRLRNNAGILGNLAQAYFALGRYEEARETFRKAARVDPRQVHYQLGLANSLAMQGRLAEAEPLLKRAVERFPAEPLAWFNYGNVLRDLGRTADALLQFSRAVELAPEFTQARNNLAGALHNLQRFADAETQFRACIAQAPDYLLAKCNLASVLIDVGRFAEAESLCRNVIRADSQLAIAHIYLGATLGHQGRLLDALESYRLAVHAESTKQTLDAYAGALGDVGRYAESERWFCRSAAYGALSPSAHQTFATTQLARGCMAQGWEEYAWRPGRQRFVEKHRGIALDVALPRELGGRHVCLLREQGLGDEAYFLRWTRVLKERGARVTCRTSEKIRSLFARAPFIDDVVGENDAMPAADHYVLMGDLPHALGAQPATPLPPLSPDAYIGHMRDLPERMAVFWPPLPPALPLQPLDDRLAEIRKRLERAGPPPYIGITWRGGTAPETQDVSWVLYKECPIERLAPAISRYRGTAIALQRKPAAGEIDAFSAALGRPLHDFSDCNEDLETMLALLALIDEYVGVSNTNMHLRAGVGRAARVLVPCPAEWRWMHGRARSPWFPNFPVYRQSLQGDWSAALDGLGNDLTAASCSLA